MYQNSTFEIVGHNCLLGEYPSLVTPIGKLEGTDTFVAIYLKSDKQNITLEPISKEASFTRYSKEVRESLKNFDYKEDVLFATSDSEVEYYPVQEEKEFFRKLLRNQEFSAGNPFLRLTFAEYTKDFLLVYREITACENYFKEHDPETIPLWKLEKIVEVLGMTQFRALDDGRFYIDKEQLLLLRQVISVESKAALKALKRAQMKLHIQQALKIDRLQEKNEQLERENLDLKADFQRISDSLHSLILVDVEPIVNSFNEMLKPLEDEVRRLPKDLPPSLQLSESELTQVFKIRLLLSEPSELIPSIETSLDIIEKILELTSGKHHTEENKKTKRLKLIKNDLIVSKKQFEELVSQTNALEKLQRLRSSTFQLQQSDLNKAMNLTLLKKNFAEIEKSLEDSIDSYVKVSKEITRLVPDAPGEIEASNVLSQPMLSSNSGSSKKGIENQEMMDLLENMENVKNALASTNAWLSSQSFSKNLLENVAFQKKYVQ